MTMPTAQETFRRLTIGDPRLLAAFADDEGVTPGPTRLDERTERLLRLAALILLDAPQSAYDTAVAEAVRAGADLDDLVGVLLALAGTAGSVRVMAAAPRIALAAGYDVEAALETLEPGQ
jgi:alkylhydroperoxidase/carboxymuconolactone decarboxylase family protein YurZ